MNGDPTEVEVFYENSVVEVIPVMRVDVIEVVDEGPQGPEGPPGTGVDEFLELTDTPDSYAGEANKNVSVKSDESGLEFTDPVIPTFLALTDTPDSYVGQAFKVVTVKETEDGLAFSTAGGAGFNSTIYKFSTTITPGDPGAGRVRFDSATQASIANIFIDDLNEAGTDLSAFFALLKAGDVIMVQDQGNSANVIRFTVSAPATDNTGWWTIPVTYVSHQGSLPSNNARVLIAVQLSPLPTTITEDQISLSDVLTNNVSTTRHGFQPKLPDDPTLFMDGQGHYSPLPITGLQGSYRISGGGVAWTGTGLNFIISACDYVINGVQYHSNETPVTLAPADPTFARTDVFAVTATPSAVVITGTPGGPPVEPQVDPATQLKLTSVDIAAGATTPSITTENIYLENTEWVATANAGTINPNSINNPYAGTKCVEATAAVNGNLFTCVKPSGSLKPSDYATLVFQIRSKAGWPSPKALSIFWMNGATSVGIAQTLKNGSFGFDSSNTTTYQQIAIPASAFNTGASSVDRLRIQATGGGASFGWYIDNIVLQSGSGGGTPGGDFSTNTNVSIAGELVAFADTTGKLGKRATEGTEYLGPNRISDAVYDQATWNGDTNHAASKNAIRDKIESMVAAAITNFLGLTDTPDSYSGQASKVVAVKATEDGLEFITVSVSLGKGAVGFSFGKSSGLSTGKVKGFAVIPYAATITAFNFVIDTGTATVKVWKIATGTAKPTAANSINTSGVSISTGTALRSTTLSDFTTTAVAANDIFAFEITALGGSPTEIMFELELTKT